MKISINTVTSSVLAYATLLACVAATPFWMEASDGAKYLVEESRKYNWLEALDECARRGLQLVVIDSDSKNTAFVAKLKYYYSSSRSFWLGHHDEFGTSKSSSRPFYSASTGNQINFGYWTSGNPSNDKKNEHCVHTNNNEFRWNDMPCDKYNFGYICEEHYLTTRYRNDLTAKRQTVKQKNAKTSTDFTTTQNKVKEINKDTQQNTDNALVDFKSSASKVIEDFKKSLNALILEKSYMQAVMADIGDSIRDLTVEAQEKMDDITNQTQQTITDIHVKATSMTNSANAEFAQILTNNMNEIDKLLQ